MKKRNFVTLSVVLGLLSSCLPVVATDPPEQKPPRTLPKTANEFIAHLKEKQHETLNNMGYHFPNLGRIQEQFYASCKKHDQDEAIKQPVTLIIGGGEGLIATELLKQTQRTTVIFNDLEPNHFTGLKKWVIANGYLNRVIFISGTFFDIGNSKEVQKFFKRSEFQVHDILAANVFHHLSPQQFLEGLKFVSDHLLPQGDAFLMNAVPTAFCDHDKHIALAIRTMASVFSAGGESEKFLFESYTKKDLEKFFLYVQDRQAKILYEFNKAEGILFPGYISSEIESLNPFLISFNGSDRFNGSKVTRDIGGHEKTSYFYTTPQELEQWSNSVGLTCSVIERVTPYVNDNTLYESSDNEKFFYSSLLRKRASTSTSAEKCSDNEYLKLINAARQINAKLKQRYANKKFEVRDEAPYFGITDLTTGKRHSDRILSPAEAREYDAQHDQQLWNNLFTNDESLLIRVYAYAAHCWVNKDYELASTLFRMGSDLEVEDKKCTEALIDMKKEGVYVDKWYL